MIVSIAIAVVTVLIGLLLWMYRRFNEIYYWRNDSGDVIKGTGFIIFSPQLIAFKDARLKQFGLYLLRFLPGPPKLIITDPQTAVNFMSKQRKYQRLKDFRLGSIFTRLFGHAVGTASGDTHKRMRSAFDGCYSANSVSQAVTMMKNECEEYLRRIVQEKEGILTMDDLIDLTFRMLMKYTYGRQIRENELKELRELRTLVGQLIAETFTNPFVKFLLYQFMPTKGNKLLTEFEHRWIHFNKRFEERFKEGKLEDENCVFYKMQETLVKTPEALTPDEFQQTLEEASLANVDITCGAAAWLLFHVALHQQVQQELVHEIKKLITKNVSDELTLDGIKKLGFLGKVVKESARKRPVMVISTPEYVTCPMDVGGYRSTAKVEVSVDNSAVNSDKGVWGDTETFNPQRFNKETPRMRNSLCRFGIGPRRCMGYRVADAFMKVLMVTLLENYSVTLETCVTGDDDSVPVEHVGPFSYPCVMFKVASRVTEIEL